MKALPLDERPNTVWIESARCVPLSSTAALDSSDYVALTKALSEEERLTLIHEQEDFVTQWSEVLKGGMSWGRIRRYGEVTIAPNPAQSVVYEDTICRTIASDSGSGVLLPLVSCISVQQSVAAAVADAWVRVAGVVKYENISLGILQEWDGDGCVLALRGGELKPLFVLEALMGCSSAMWRQSHEMWLGARYPGFRYRCATWSVPTKPDLGPCASSFHARLRDALARMGYAQVGAALVQQLDRVKEGFASGSEQKLFDDARLAAEA